MQRMKGIFLKLFVTYLAILLLSFFVSSTISFMLMRSNSVTRHQQMLFNEQDTVIQHIRNSYEKGWGRDVLVSSLELSIARQDKVYYFFDSAGNLIYQVGHMEVPFTVDQNIIQSVLKGEKLSQRMEVDHQHLLLVASPINGNGQMQEKAIVMVFDGFDKEFAPIKPPFLIGVISSIAITGLCIFFISKRFTDPLREMNRIAYQFAKGQFEQRVKVRSEDEIGQLGDTLNYMAKELSGLDQMRKEFVANVSHDLRSPLTSIHGFLGALIDGTISHARQQHYLLIMREETERLMKLVNDLLDMARMEAGQWEIRVVPFNLTEQVRKVIARMEPEFQKHKVAITMIADEEHDSKVLADSDRIDQVMTNLLQNAIQHSPAGSSIDVKLEEKEGNAVISVRDYGPGIKEDDLRLIWQRFYKGDKARSKKVGTGIGLSIVKHILELHNAPIDVESEVGKGTVFTFTLPLG